jgi:hypothetical protein
MEYGTGILKVKELTGNGAPIVSPEEATPIGGGDIRDFQGELTHG